MFIKSVDQNCEKINYLIDFNKTLQTRPHISLSSVKCAELLEKFPHFPQFKIFIAQYKIISLLLIKSNHKK